MTKSNESKSLPKTKIIHSVEIRKMPCGKYFEALQTLKNLPEDFMKELLKDKKDFKLSEMFTMENISELIVKLIIMLPDFTFNFLSILTDIDREKIENELTPKELVDVVKVYWEINELESFFDQMKSIMSKITTLIGFKELLPSALKSE
ncbi:MAG: hypothetical protein HFJ48_04020 [Clostridia bacterium]|nr:hypothetical protein [Clostridia bacterium]